MDMKKIYRKIMKNIVSTGSQDKQKMIIIKWQRI